MTGREVLQTLFTSRYRGFTLRVEQSTDGNRSNPPKQEPHLRMKRHLFAGFCLALMTLANVAHAQSLSYVGSEACTDCHREQAEQWQSSHHALAWTKPGPTTVLGDFDGAELAHDGTLTRFSTGETDGEYAVTVTEKDGQTTQYPLHSVVGIAPLQQYLLETDPGRLQSFDVVWDVEKQQWYHLYPDQDLPPTDGLHWTGPYKTWNARCAECHATGYQRNFGARTGRYSSTQAEIGVGCESCHGPGSAHLDWTKTKTSAPETQKLSAFGFPTSFGAGNTEAEIQQCAGCHSRREALGNGNPTPGTAYHDAYTLALLRPGLYHADGQIQDEVYVYGSFLQSKMYARGVGCTNCHNPHNAALKATGNAVCTQCHSPAGNPEFPTLPLAEFDSPSHSFHASGTEGAQCKSCHMIERTYMGVDGRRDHSFRIPRPDLGAETGGPDACTDCHADQTQGWAAQQIETWYPNSQKRGAHYGQVLAHGRSNPQQAAGSLQDLALDATQPGIVRATALYLLQSEATPELADLTAPLLSDPDPVIRGSAAVLQRGASLDVRVDRLMPSLRDPMRSVRIAAAKQLLDPPVEQLLRSQRALLGEAMGDWQRSLAGRLDFPETHLVMGGMALTMRNFPVALNAFREVVRMDPQRAEAWSMLVRLSEALEGPEAGRATLREAIKNAPNDPALLQMLGQVGK
ncbi:MAG: putative CXXCH cytochrome family protein [Paracoccaceae bacterium]|jgi:predicted CXXCH cytochrome family protein